ncbi:hypothetical protein I3842_01G117100 [Carya illinoinensis]|uniref:Uncharacterized protein n=1 Tax=Carya illinoinensis TaxID=32201 RepID=A0A922G2B0_CARIL|nr:hypothetical protein I3842_01G117100 [Carya illinoinensis]
MIYQTWFKSLNRRRHIIKIRKKSDSRIRNSLRLKEILILKENHISRDSEFVCLSIITNKSFLSRTISHKGTRDRLCSKFVTLNRWQMNKTKIPKSMNGLILRRYAK